MYSVWFWEIFFLLFLGWGGGEKGRICFIAWLPDGISLQSKKRKSVSISVLLEVFVPACSCTVARCFLFCNHIQKCDLFKYSVGEYLVRDKLSHEHLQTGTPTQGCENSTRQQQPSFCLYPSINLKQKVRIFPRSRRTFSARNTKNNHVHVILLLKQKENVYVYKQEQMFLHVFPTSKSKYYIWASLH